MQPVDVSAVRTFLALLPCPGEVRYDVVADDPVPGGRRLRLEIACPDDVHAAVDDRVAFAATSGAAGTYRVKLANEIGIDRALVVPGVMDAFDVDDLTRLIAPRPLAIFAGAEDRYALDAAEVGESTRSAYRRARAGDRLHVEIAPGGHALTMRRSRAIVDWVVETASPG